MQIDVSGSIEWLYDWQLRCEEADCPWMYETSAEDEKSASLADFVKQADAHYATDHPEKSWR